MNFENEFEERLNEFCEQVKLNTQELISTEHLIFSPEEIARRMSIANAAVEDSTLNFHLYKSLNPSYPLGYAEWRRLSMYSFALLVTQESTFAGSSLATTANGVLQVYDLMESYSRFKDLPSFPNWKKRHGIESGL